MLDSSHSEVFLLLLPTVFFHFFLFSLLLYLSVLSPLVFSSILDALATLRLVDSSSPTERYSSWTDKQILTKFTTGELTAICQRIPVVVNTD